MVLKNIRSREEIKAAMSAALKEGNTEAYLNAFDEICDSIAQDIRAEFEQSRNEQDAKILAERGVRQLTSAEKTYYSKVIDAMRSADPKMALSNLDVVMPRYRYRSGIHRASRTAPSAFAYPLYGDERRREDAGKHQR